MDYGYRLANKLSDLTRPQINFLISALVSRIEKIAAARGGEAGVTKFVFAEDEDIDQE